MLYEAGFLMESVTPAELLAVPKPLRPGDVCPQCGEGHLDYNGVLMLACSQCDFVLAEGGGCT
jgi:hypothetical protein